MTRARRSASVTSRGITLVEVMVTVAIVSVTLLGMAGLQIVALRSTNGSVYRTQAALLADDIAERMRGNPEAVRAGAFSEIDSRTFDCGAPPAVACAVSQETPDPTELQCSVEELAIHDLSDWLCGGAQHAAHSQGGVLRILPDARAQITCDAAPCEPDTTHTISIEWSVPDPDRQGESEETQRLALRIQP